MLAAFVAGGMWNLRMFYYVSSWLLCPLKSAVDSIHFLIVWSQLYRTKLVVCLVGILIGGGGSSILVFSLTCVLIYQVLNKYLI